jgi:beta-glucosidase
LTFLWGVATSAYQIEGGIENDWTDWEAAGRLRARHERCSRAADHENLWQQDFLLLPTIGANAYRFSLEWARVEPEEGKISESALALYRRRIELLRHLGIEPVLTLFHYTHPRWFWRYGWESREGVDAFRRHVGRVADAVGDLVTWYTIVNEPLVFILGGYLDGSIPPGRKSFPLAMRALEGLLRGHTEARAILKEKNPAARFGIAHNMMSLAPERPRSWLDRMVTSAADRFYNEALLEGMATGRLDFRLPLTGRWRFENRDLPASCDFVGVNYYSRLHLRFSGRSRLLHRFFYRDAHGRGLTDTGWEIHPAGMQRCLETAAQTGLPVLVTENGIATRRDSLRADFLREHAVMLGHARRSGIPLEGYFYWSLIDNFEWLEGFSPRFGLFEVDYATYARRRRPSADVFGELGRRFFTPA